jgi:hypothetical protein
MVGSVALAAAALDEFARVPFYHTSAVAALLACGGSLTLRLCGRRRVVGLGISAATATPATAPQLLHAARTSGGAVDRPEVEAALRKVHSVAWGFPGRARATSPLKQEACVNYESRR